MAAYARRDFNSGGAAATTLSSGIASGATSFSIAASTGWPSGSGGDFFVVLDRGTSTEEKILCASRTSLSVTVQTSGRGSDGTSAVAHSSGAAAEVCFAARDGDEANLAVAKTIGVATAVGQILVVDAANSFAAVQAKASGQVLLGNGTTLASTVLSGDVTVNGSGVTAIGASKITSAKIVDGTIVDADINAAAAIALTKLATDPLARANHTGTQLMATVSDAGTLATLSTVDSAHITDGTIVAADLASDAVTTVKILDANVTTAKLADANVTLAKVASEAWTAWTPAITGFTKVNGTVLGRYHKSGRRLTIGGIYTIGSSDTIGAILTVGSFPFAPANLAGLGTVTITDTSAGTTYPGGFRLAVGATSAAIVCNEVFTAPGAVFQILLDSTHPFTLDTGDTIEWTLTYETSS